MRGQSVEQRFLKKVKKLDNGCWEWQACVSNLGYGRFPIRRTGGGFKIGYAHRWAYEYWIGEIGPGLEVDHVCRNTRCCNPEHLRTVTHRENLLAGETLAATNAAKTHCCHGHAFTPENTYKLSNGGRACRECNRIRQAAWQAIHGHPSIKK